MSEISEVRAREILDARGTPTVEVELLLETGALGRAAVPSGASTGEREALELRDGDKTRYLGKGVSRAVEHVNQTIAPEVVGLEATNQAELDRLLCGLGGAGGQGGGRRRGPAPVPVPRRGERQGPAGPDDEHPERRQARGQHRGPPGVHDHALARRAVQREPARRRGGVPPPAGRAQE